MEERAGEPDDGAAPPDTAQRGQDEARLFSAGHLLPGSKGPILRDFRKLSYPSMVNCAKKRKLGGTRVELTEEVKALVLNTAKELRGSARRMFMARTVQALGEGGQRLAERELGWNRVTIRKGKHEVESGMMCLDGFRLRGRKHSEDHLPNLLTDITAIVDGQSQADPQFRTTRLYTRLTATEVRRQLMAQKDYTDAELSTAETIGTKLNQLGYYPKKVAKSQPQKNFRRPMPSLPR